MEIKKSKKLLKALIATSFVGVVATPIMLTSCAKKKVEFADKILKEVKFKEDVKNTKGDGECEVKFTDFDANKTKTLACVVGDTENDEKKNADVKSFTITLELPFEENDKDATFKLSDPVVKSEGTEDDKKNFVKFEKGVDEKNKKVVKYNFTVEKDVKGLAKKPAEATADSKVLSPDKTYTTITFKFTDAKDEKNSAEFTYKVTFAEPNK